MKDDDLADAISAALDGEAVDLAALRDALKTTEGRELLASCVLIRATAGADIEPSEQFSAALRKSFDRRRRSWVLSGPRVPASIAASLVALAIAGSLFGGRAIWSQAPRDDGRPATAAPAALTGPARPISGQAVPATEVPTSSGRGLPVQSVEQRGSGRGQTPRQPPRPSRVLRFEDWRHGV